MTVANDNWWQEAAGDAEPLYGLMQGVEIAVNELAQDVDLSDPQVAEARKRYLEQASHALVKAKTLNVNIRHSLGSLEALITARS